MRQEGKCWVCAAFFVSFSILINNLLLQKNKDCPLGKNSLTLYSFQLFSNRYCSCRKKQLWSLGPNLTLQNQYKVGVVDSKQFDAPHNTFGACLAI